MAIFKLSMKGKDISDANLVEAPKVKLEFEKYLEGWLERSPWAIAQEPFLWIGRQTSASVEEGTVFPDLLGIDQEGNLVLVELKKGKAPREVIAQLLEYAAWAADLPEERIEGIAVSYWVRRNFQRENDFAQVFRETFETDQPPSLNHRLRLFIVAEEIPAEVARVSRFLRMSHGLDINCVAISVYQTEGGEIRIGTESVVGQEDVIPPKHAERPRWSGDKPVKQVVREAVQGLTKGDKNLIFSPREVSELILEKHPAFNKSTVGCQIISDSVNHTSRHHYPGGEDYYWWSGQGKYRLHDPERDTLKNKVSD
jgi:hypothetical protein